MLTTVHPSDVIAIVNSVHRNPHWVLGMHVVEINDVDGKPRKALAVRGFFPDAKSACIVDRVSKKEWVMEKVHDSGFFEGMIRDKSEKFSYFFKLQDYFGNEWEMDDAYEKWVDGVTSFDSYLFARSTHYKVYEKLGAHVLTQDGRKGVYFSVWAPNAARVSVVGDFNYWDGRKHPMEILPDCGVWVLFVPNIGVGEKYKFEIKTKSGDIKVKADPYATHAQLRPDTASVVFDLNGYQWGDESWLKRRESMDACQAPMSIYEVHLGSWRRVPEEGNRYLTYREFADVMVPYVSEMGYTHIELMPIAEHPFDGSWGYQVTGYFAPTSRFGTPHDLMYFIDKCHQAGIGVLLDWVPGHFPKDDAGLVNFDGTALYEHEDPRLGEHMDWGTKIFNYGRHEVKNFLISNAVYWMDKFHFDGLRVDAVASMLYLDYSRKDGEWLSNYYGGRENLEAIEFFRHLNSVLYQYFPGVTMMAEESTAWPGVSKPAYAGGLGFGLKWNMGWMHDILQYTQRDPIHKRYHHGELTFGFLYAWSENFILPFSHDEVVHGKGSMISKMPGTYEQKFANLRALYTYQYTHPGKKLLFMGEEIGQFDEWNHERSLDWHLLDFDGHRGLRQCVMGLNKLYKEERALWERDPHHDGFCGINCDDSDNSVISFIRRAADPADYLIVVVNFTPVNRYDYVIGVPEHCYYEEVFNSDAANFGGQNIGNMGGCHANWDPAFYQSHSMRVTVPPLGGVIFKPRRG